MQLPVLRGLIDRRILVNFRVTPDVLAGILPPPFRPKLVGGYGMAGICLIRLMHLRPRFWPAWGGLSSENAAHRIAVEWTDAGTIREGVYVPRRDSSSLWNTLIGGRLFPGVHHHSRFLVQEANDCYRVQIEHRDGTRLDVSGKLAAKLPADSIFESLDRASSFFGGGSRGYSATKQPGVYDGLELRTLHWEMAPLSIDRVESTYFANESLFPAGSVKFDCALLMRHLEHEWHGLPSLCAK